MDHAGEPAAFGGQGHGIVMVAGDVLEGAGEFPAGGEAGAQGLVIDADDLSFEIDVADIFFCRALGNFDERFAEGLHLDQDAHIVDQAGEEGFVWQGIVQFAHDELGHDADGDRMGPEIFGGEVGRNAAAAEELGEGGGDDDVFDGIEAQQDDGAVD